MTLLSEVFNLAHRFLGNGPRKDCLDRLPNEVLLDILYLLDVVDIIRLRRVSQLYHQLTQDGALWKKLLRCADVPLPMLPPTSQHTTDRMSGLEAERVLVRAHSMARNWRSLSPKALREWVFDTSDYRVVEMAVLPGGNHLVTSASDRNGVNYSLIVWDMDVKGKPKMVAAIATATKAYEIQAKYMTINGENSIVLAYLTRDYHRKKDRIAAELGRIQRAGQLSTYHKIDAEFRYECAVSYLPLENLQRYVDIPYPCDTPQYRAEMEKLPKAFNHVTKITTSRTLACPILGELFGAPHLVVVKGDKDLVFKKLVGNDRATATLTCMDTPILAQWSHTIKAIKLLPQEHSVFVVREVDKPRPLQSRRPAYLFETYLALRCGLEPKNQQHFSQCVHFDDSGILGDLTHIYVPDFPPYIRSADLVADDQRPPAKLPRFPPSSQTCSAPDPPPPICIYAHRSNPEGIIRILFHARCFVNQFPPSPITPTSHAGLAPGGVLERTQTTYRYTLESCKKLFQRVADPDDVVRIIPSATRPLVCLTEWDDLSSEPFVCELRPFVDHGWEEPPRVVEHFVEHPRPGTSIGSKCFGGDGISGPDSLGKRVAAFAWDETIGRLIVAEEGVSALTVFDFAAAPRHSLIRSKRPHEKPAVDADILMMPVIESAAASAQGRGSRVAQGRQRSRSRAHAAQSSSTRRVARGSSASACR